MDKLI